MLWSILLNAVKALVTLALLNTKSVAQESVEACNARAEYITQQNKNNAVKKEVPKCPPSPKVVSSGVSTLDGKVVGSYVLYSNGVIVRVFNGVVKTCIQEVCN